MSVSDAFDGITKTFSADHAFCERLFQSDQAENAAEILVFHHWGYTYLPHFQNGLRAAVPSHFPLSHVNTAVFWTDALTGGVIKDIGLATYLAVRGLGAEAGSVLRRSLEHCGVLTHLWRDPGKITSVGDHGTSAYKDAFLHESSSALKSALSARGVSKRFAECTFGAAATNLYRILSEYHVHGGTPVNLLNAELEPTRFSCAFLNRTHPVGKLDFRVLVTGIQILCAEVAFVQGTVGKQCDVTPSRVAEGGRVLSQLLPANERRSAEMDRRIKSLLAILHSNQPT